MHAPDQAFAVSGAFDATNTRSPPRVRLTQQGLGEALEDVHEGRDGVLSEDSVRDTLSRDYFQLIAKLIAHPAASAYV